MLALQAEEGEGSGNPSEPQPPTAQPTHKEPIPNIESQTKKVYGTAYTKFIMKVKKLEKTVKTSQARRRANIVVSVDDIASEDSSKQGRMIEEIDQDVGVTLVTLTKVSSQEDQPEDQLGVLSIAKVLADATRVHTYSNRSYMYKV
ncbi:hypothetical protein Tco_0134554 [Tanacetum coccineum]